MYENIKMKKKRFEKRLASCLVSMLIKVYQYGIELGKLVVALDGSAIHRYLYTKCT